MPTLNWIGKEKIVNHDKEVPFRLLKKNQKLSLGKSSENLIVEGDNLEALKALMPFYYGKVKCIYIDPPYNTGNEKWVYNDKVSAPKIKEWLGKVVGAEGEDLSRHDKWLCMMYPRLKLLRDLLRDDGVIFISIDDNEQHNLRFMMDEIFGEENFVANIVWQKKYGPANDARYLSETHEYITCYSKNKLDWKPNLIGRDVEQLKAFKNIDKDPRGPWRASDLSARTYSANTDYPITGPNGQVFYPPKSRSWIITKARFKELLSDNRITFGVNGDGRPMQKKFLSEVKEGITIQTWWDRDFGGDNKIARYEIKDIFPENSFETPKPSKLIKKILEISTDKDSIILDSFAGSGTTAQAVLELNKEDSGNRKFILVELEEKIAREITSERVKRASEMKDLNGSFEYADLGDPLFDKNGAINEQVSFSELASYIYFTETHTNLEKKNIKGNCLGERDGTEYYLLFDGIGKNVLNRKLLSGLKKEGNKVVYADKCLIDADVLKKHNVVFKQIPYEVKVY